MWHCLGTNTTTLSFRKRQSAAARQLPHSDLLCFDDDALLAAAASHGQAAARAADRQAAQHPLGESVIPQAAPSSCHVAGQASVPASQKAPSAPLSLTHPRREAQPSSKADNGIPVKQQQPAIAASAATADPVAAPLCQGPLCPRKTRNRRGSSLQSGMRLHGRCQRRGAGGSRSAERPQMRCLSDQNLLWSCWRQRRRRRCRCSHRCTCSPWQQHRQQRRLQQCPACQLRHLQRQDIHSCDM